MVFGWHIGQPEEPAGQTRGDKADTETISMKMRAPAQDLYSTTRRRGYAVWARGAQEPMEFEQWW